MPLNQTDTIVFGRVGVTLDTTTDMHRDETVEDRSRIRDKSIKAHDIVTHKSMVSPRMIARVA